MKNAQAVIPKISSDLPLRATLPRMKKASLFVFASLCVVGICALAITSYGQVKVVHDVKLYREIGLAAQVEGAGMKSEYPPLATALFMFVESQLFTDHFPLAWVVAILVSITAATIYAGLVLGAEEALLLPAALIASILLLGSAIHFGRFDIFIGLLLFLTWRMHVQKRFGHAGCLLALAGFLKIIPFAAGPLLFFLTPAKRRYSFCIGFLIGTALSLLIPLLLLGPSLFIANIEYMVSYHGGRGFQVESTWSAVDMLYRALVAGGKSTIVFRLGAFENTSVSVPLLLPVIISFTGMAGIYLAAWHRRPDVSLPFFALFLWLLGTATVLSPQYFIWILPLLLAWGFLRLRSAPKRAVWYGLFLYLTAFIGLATQWIFPLYYNAFLSQQELIHTLILALRSVAVLCVTAMLVKEIFSKRAR